MSRTILISGTDHGLGAALAQAFAHGGDTVFAGVLDPAAAALPDRRFPSGGSLARLWLDIGSDAGVSQAMALLRERTGRLDILVNNGAILGDISRSALDGGLDFAEMARVYDVNVLGSLRLSQACLPLLLAGGEKLIVNVSSEAGSIGACGRDRWYAYAMSKAALNMQSALLHNLLRPQGGQVLVLHPGHVRTFMRGEEDTSASLTPEQAASLVLANIERARGQSGERPAYLGPNGETLPW